MKTAILKLIEDLESCGVDCTKIHWIAKDKEQQKNAQFILRNFFNRYGPVTVNTRMGKYCKQNGCLNPLHYHQVLIEKEISDETLEEVETLMMMIDLDDLQEFGFGQYFKIFNKDNPLPAKKQDFYLACNRKLKQWHKEPFGREVLDE